MESITNYIYYCVNNISELSFIIDVLEGKLVEQHEKLKQKIKIIHQLENNDSISRQSSATSLENKDKKNTNNSNNININSNNEKNINPSLLRLRSKKRK